MAALVVADRAEIGRQMRRERVPDAMSVPSEWARTTGTPPSGPLTATLRLMPFAFTIRIACLPPSRPSPGRGRAPAATLLHPLNAGVARR